MQGMRFLTVGEQGPTNHGIIAGRITAEKYLCNFAKNPTSCRVCDITEIQQWHLFHTDDEMNAFILALRKEQPPVVKPEPVKKKAKKKAKKRVKHNGTK